MCKEMRCNRQSWRTFYKSPVPAGFSLSLQLCHIQCTSCKNECETHGKIMLPGATNKYSCSHCQCSCPTFQEDLCEKQCNAQGKVPIKGARDIQGCPICQCDCLTRDCAAECHGYNFSSEIGEQNCVIGCKCICPGLDCNRACGGSGKGTVSERDRMGCPTKCGKCECPDIQCDIHCFGQRDEFGCSTNCIGCKHPGT